MFPSEELYFIYRHALEVIRTNMGVCVLTAKLFARRIREYKKGMILIIVYHKIYISFSAIDL